MIRDYTMSAYETVVGGKLKLKGKPLNVKAGGIKKKKKKHNKHQDHVSQLLDNDDLSQGFYFLLYLLFYFILFSKIVSDGCYNIHT